jgi:hypothetical protein
MKFKTVIEIIKRSSLPHVKTPLGRWNIHNYSETTLKIKYANEDNSFYNHKKYIKLDNDDPQDIIYMMGYDSL